MKLRLLMALPAALLSPRTGAIAEPAAPARPDAEDGGCPICDHPFGSMRHVCLS